MPPAPAPPPPSSALERGGGGLLHFTGKSVFFGEERGGGKQFAMVKDRVRVRVADLTRCSVVLAGPGLGLAGRGVSSAARCPIVMLRRQTKVASSVRWALTMQVMGQQQPQGDAQCSCLRSSASGEREDELTAMPCGSMAIPPGTARSVELPGWGGGAKEGGGGNAWN